MLPQAEFRIVRTPQVRRTEPSSATLTAAQQAAIAHAVRAYAQHAAAPEIPPTPNLYERVCASARALGTRVVDSIAVRVERARSTVAGTAIPPTPDLYAQVRAAAGLPPRDVDRPRPPLDGSIPQTPSLYDAVRAAARAQGLPVVDPIAERVARAG